MQEVDPLYIHVVLYLFDHLLVVGFQREGGLHDAHVQTQTQQPAGGLQRLSCPPHHQGPARGVRQREQVIASGSETTIRTLDFLKHYDTNS